jgi:hypothetical protein
VSARPDAISGNLVLDSQESHLSASRESSLFSQSTAGILLTLVPVSPLNMAIYVELRYNRGAFDLSDVSSNSAPQRDLPAELCSIQRKIRKKEIATQWKQEQ